MKNQKLHQIIFKPENPWYLILAAAGLLGGALIALSFLRASNTSSLLSCGGGGRERASSPALGQTTMDALVHYATSSVVPQQSLKEISVTYEVLKAKLLGNESCNFLVFGLGRDSMMWAGLNPRGKTLFLEEDPKWVQEVLKDAPALRAQTVRYRTELKEADQLMKHYVDEPDCSVKRSFIRGNEKCRLALNMLSDEVYDTEWDLIMIDAPRGYFAEAPGRMAAIYSAAVMARNRRRGSGPTHIFLHDVDRVVEKTYATKFLCKKYLVKAVGRLWHFEIPPATEAEAASDFC